MAYLGDIGRIVPGPNPQYGGNAFTYIRPSGMVIEIDPVVPGAIIVIHRRGTLADKRRADDLGIVRFYDLGPGTYIANSVYDGQTGAAWSIVVTPTTYTVTRISSPVVAGFIAFG